MQKNAFKESKNVWNDTLIYACFVIAEDSSSGYAKWEIDLLLVKLNVTDACIFPEVSFFIDIYYIELFWVLSSFTQLNVDNRRNIFDKYF